MSNSREIEINNISATTVDKLLDRMFENKGTYAIFNKNNGSQLILCMEDEHNYIFEQGYAQYFVIKSSKLLLSAKLYDSLGARSEDIIEYSTLNENRASLCYKCFTQEEETPDNNSSPRYR